jgi:hypothetical protein
MKPLKHKHHIIPKHMGGSNDPENIAILSPEEHAEEHKKLYEKFGKIEDYLAWKGLSGFIGKEEIIMEIMRDNGKKLGARMLEEGRGIFDPEQQKTEKYKEGIKEGGRIIGKRMAESGHCKRVAPLGGGKNLGKLFWFNPETKKETQTFNCPGEGWVLGRDPEKLEKSIEFMREVLNKNFSMKGSFWVLNKETGETRMIFPDQDIPEGFVMGRSFERENKMVPHNTSDKLKIDGVPQVNIEYDNIIFNPSSLRWEYIPKSKGKRIVKISHTDYYGLVWVRDCYIDFLGLNRKKSQFNFCEESPDKVLEVLKDWREYHLTKLILETKKLKKARRKTYSERLESLRENFEYLEGIRKKINPLC